MHVRKNSTVSAIAVVDLADELISRNMIDQTTLKVISHGLESVFKAHHSGLSIIEKRLPETDLLSLWEIANSCSSIPSLGVDIGQSVTVNAKGLLAGWLSCCDTLKQALDVFHDNISLLNEAEFLSVKHESQHIKLCFKFSSSYTYPVMATERSMVALVAWAEYFTSSKLNVKRAQFVFEKPAYSHLYTAIFGANVHFNADENAIELFDSELNKTVQSSNPYLRKIIAENSESAPFQAAELVTIQAKVESLLRTDLMTYCHLDAHLRMLRMSKATLYRKLKEEGTSFTALVLKERMAILSKLQKVHIHYSNEHSSEALGFKDVSSFYKFLKKNTVTK
tara:strand:+ start:5848 stop:6858 length:1011 start_codon:yes stop_codon:yes gene_type:complete